MIITRTPFRISFVGGGSDMASFYLRSSGCVLSTTIDKYMYISSHHFFEESQIRLKYSKTETVDHVDNISHPIFKTALKKFGITGGIEFSSIADVPAGTGMGSSSSFTVGLLQNLYATHGRHVSKEQLAREASEIEIDLLQEPIGKQDQYAAAFGGLNVFRFNPDESVNVDHVFLKPAVFQQLQKNLILFYTGEQRHASKILQEQKQNINEDRYFNIVLEMTQLVSELKQCLVDGQLENFGKLLSHNWELKKNLGSKISNPHIDALYALALRNGALGGKLLGAGGSGFLLFYCPWEKQEHLTVKLGLRKFDFKLETEGSKVIHFTQEP